MEKVLNPNEYGGLLYDEKEIEAIEEVIKNKKIFRYATKERSKTDDFEEEICKKFNRKYALGINSGTSALKVALKAIGIKENDRVLISAYTFLATATSVIALGGIPVPIDFDLEYGMNLDDLKQEIGKGCKAIVLVHLQGKCFDVRPIIKIKEEYNIPLIEDACQAMGTKNSGIYAGNFSDIGVFSFQQNKPLTSGEGGVLITNSKEYYKVARNYSDMGGVRDFYLSWEDEGALIGDNYRMNNLQGAILYQQLLKMDYMEAIQIKNKKYILENINKKEMLSKIINDISGDDTGINLLMLTKNDSIAKKCIEVAKKYNIEIRYLWNKPYYMHRVIKNARLAPEDLKKSNCDNAENISKTLISISLPPILTVKELDLIVDTINMLIKEYSL